MTLPLIDSQPRYDSWLANLVEREIAEARSDLAAEASAQAMNDVPDEKVLEDLLERRETLEYLDVFSSDEHPEVFANIVWYSRTDPTQYMDWESYLEPGAGDGPRDVLKTLAWVCLDADYTSSLHERLG